MKRFHITRDGDYANFLDLFMKWRDGKYKLTVTVEKYSKRRSTDANRFYFGVVVHTLAEHTGYSIPEMHDEILGQHFGWEMKTVGSHTREFPRRRSTSPDVLSTSDFQSLIQTGQKIAADLGVVLPDLENVDQD